MPVLFPNFLPLSPVNAIKYSKGNNDKIEIESQKQNNSVILSIKDYGVGINEKDISRVFEKGFTGDNGRKKRSNQCKNSGTGGEKRCLGTE